MKISNNIFSIILFAILSFIIVLPLLSPGYILTLDTVMTEKIIFPELTSPSFLFSLVLWFLHLLIPSYFLQKIMLFLIFFLSGFGMYRLIPEKYGLSRYFGGIFYAVNPFVYERVMAGQWALLLGYGLFPFVVSLVLDFFDKPSRKAAIRLGIFSTILISTVIHFSLILTIFIFIYGLIYIFFHQEKISQVARNLAVLGIAFFILNINWILPTFLGRSDVSQAVSQFTRDDLVAFQSVADGRFGLIPNLLSGYGFWPEVYDYFLLPKNIIFFWPILSLAIVGISFWGLVKLLQEKERSSYPFLITLTLIFLLALDLAGGVALKSFAATVASLYDNFPVLRGFREPQKLIGIVMFCYAFFGSIGFSSVIDKTKQNSKYLVMALFLVLPFVYTPTVFGGFFGQLKPVFYPNSWSGVNKILTKDKDNFLTLFFPWHQYMRFRFNNNRVVANLSPYFFDKPILSSQNYETMPLYSHDSRPEALHVEGLLSIEKEGVNLIGDEVNEKFPWGESLAPIGVKYIILSKDDDWKTYQFLDNQPDMKKIFESSEIDLYQNLKWGEEPSSIDNEL